MSNNNIQELFGLLSRWASLLPKQSDKRAPEDLYFIGNEIQQLCGIVERANTASVQNSATTTTEVKKEPETDFKPTFIFQLSTDDVINPGKPQFACVYDFCQELKKYCETSSKQLNIDKDWLKLLLACSSHNYERFMWIHLTFQASNNLKLNWIQVRKRLQSKFDDPLRLLKLKNMITQFQYIPEIEAIDIANQRFARLADEAQYDCREHYVDSLPEKYKAVIRSTMAFDTTKNFYYSLEDIQQRVTIFFNAKEGDFIFYSKVAHVALSLDHEKVNKSDCEFHLLAEHTTSNCPDYIIIRYPYMDFACIPGVTATTSFTINLMNLTSSLSVIPPPTPPSVAQTVSPPAEVMQLTTTTASDVLQSNQVTVKPLQFPNEPQVKQENNTPIASAPSHTRVTANTTNQTLPITGTSGIAQLDQTQLTATSGLSQLMKTMTQTESAIAEKQTPSSAVVNQILSSATKPAATAEHTQSTAGPATHHTKPAAGASQNSTYHSTHHTTSLSTVSSHSTSSTASTHHHTKPTSTTPKADSSSISALQNKIANAFNMLKSPFTADCEKQSGGVVERPRPSSSPPRRIVVMKAENGGGNDDNITVTKMRPISPPRLSRGSTRLRSISPLHERSSSSSSRVRSPSPKRRQTELTRESNSRSVSPEIGCYIHGIHAGHSTKNCRQAQMVIAPRRSVSPAYSSRSHNRGGNNGKENICIFCNLLFKPGHLGYCKEVRSKKKPPRSSRYN